MTDAFGRSVRETAGQPPEVVPSVRVERSLSVTRVAPSDPMQGAVQQLIAACDNSLSYCSDVAAWARRRSSAVAAVEPPAPELVAEMSMVVRDIDKTIRLLSDARQRLVNSTGTGKGALALP